MRTNSSTHLSVDECETLSLGRVHGHSLQIMARMLRWAPSTMSRKRAGAAVSSRHRTVSSDDPIPSATTVAYTAGPLVLAVCPDPPGSGVFARTDCRASPTRVLCRQAEMLLGGDDLGGLDMCCHEALPRELLAALLQARKARRPRSRGVDQRGQFPHITSMIGHPAEVRTAGPRPLRRRPPQGCPQWLGRWHPIQVAEKDLAFSPIPQYVVSLHSTPLT